MKIEKRTMAKELDIITNKPQILVHEVDKSGCFYPSVHLLQEQSVILFIHGHSEDAK